MQRAKQGLRLMVGRRQGMRRRVLTKQPGGAERYERGGARREGHLGQMKKAGRWRRAWTRDEA